MAEQQLKGKKDKASNPMRSIYIEKIVLNMGTSTDADRLERALKLLNYITGNKPVVTRARHRIPNWGIRKGTPIGAKVSVTGQKAIELLKRLLASRDNKLPESAFSVYGVINFGVKEYIDVPGLEYQHEIGILGFNVSIKLARKGFRVKGRYYRPSKVGKNHLITKEEAIEFMKKTFGIEVI